jgi:putative hydrolase of the HAD superfamily
VEELKAEGMRVVVGTNVIDAHYNTHIKLNQYGIFHKIYASHLMGIAKPDLSFYFHILKAEGVEAAETFFTDDHKENVDAALKLGINAFLYTDASALREQLRSLGLLGGSAIGN